MVVSQEDSIHVATRYMAHRNDGLPSLDNDAAWADLYMGKCNKTNSPSFKFWNLLEDRAHAQQHYPTRGIQAS